MPRKPMRIGRDEWRARWVQFGEGSRLHRLASGARFTNRDWYDGRRVEGVGYGVCGVAGKFRMPGFVSRMGSQRCPACCRSVGIPGGYGAPYNAFDDQKQDV